MQTEHHIINYATQELKVGSFEPEYALKTKNNPIGVAAYRLQTKLPGDLKGKLPTEKQRALVIKAEFGAGK